MTGPRSMAAHEESLVDREAKRFACEPRAVNDRDWVRETSFGTWFIGTKLWRHHVIRATLADLQRLIPPRIHYPVVVDVGCGCGRALRLLDIVFRPEMLIGVDIDRVQLRRGVAEVKRCRAKVALRVSNGACLPIPDRAVDMVFCHQTFHHFCDQETAVHEFYRVLRPGGTLLFAESCRRYIRSLPIRLLFRHPMQVQKSADEYLRLLRHAGFEVRQDAVSTPYLWWSRPDLGLLEWLGRPVPVAREETLLNVAALRPA